MIDGSSYPMIQYKYSDDKSQFRRIGNRSIEKRKDSWGIAF
jgi:hypothetical protein